MLSLPDFRNSHIAIIGDVVLDEFYDCSINRISPEAPVLIARTDNQRKTVSLGGAANTAKNCKGLGAEVSLFGIIGDDQIGLKIKELCDDDHLFNYLYYVKSVQTIHKTRYRKEYHQIVRIDYENKIQPYLVEKMIYKEIIKSFEKQISFFDAVILSDYDKGTISEYLCYNIINICNKYNIPIFVDPKGTNWNKYYGATCLTPNLKEFKQMIKKDHSPLTLAMDIINNFSLDYMLITRGKDGISFISEKETFNEYTDAQEVYDVSGAGDTVIAVFVLCRVNGLTFKNSIKLANIAAKIVISQSGTQTIKFNKLEKAVNNKNIIHSTRLVDTESIINIVNNWKEHNLKIVFTNGCFDILHTGHIYLLNEASKLGDKMIVALNSDESIKRIKDDNRPIIDQKQRAAIISNIVGVDAVVIYEEDTPINLIKKIVPDVLVKGGDYSSIDQIVGGDFIEAIGNTVTTIPLLKGLSTTNVISTIEERTR